MDEIEEYLRRPYHVVIVQDRDDNGDVGYVAEVQELPGCVSQGSTPAEAYASVQDAMYGWIKVALEDRKSIPPPAEEPEFSGRILLRCPKSLHAALSREAAKEAVSLNQFAVAALASAIDWRLGTRGARKPGADFKYRAVPLKADERARVDLDLRDEQGFANAGQDTGGHYLGRDRALVEQIEEFVLKELTMSRSRATFAESGASL